MLSHEENDLLTRVTGDAPMGKLMRQHWTPVCLIEEVAEADGKPLLVEAVGNRYVAFRDSEGKLGLLDELCPHRRASLVFGRNEDCGLRCLYHGWKFDVEGNCVAMSSEPEGSPLHDKVKHKSYKTVEWGGFVWAWLGEEEDMYPFSPPAFAPTEDTQVSILKIRIPANWAQITEGQIDSAHSSSLHSSDMKPARVEGAAADDQAWYRPSTDKSPRMQTQTTSYGFHYAAIRKPIKNAGTHNYLRITEYIAPYTSLIPPNNNYNVASVIVPIDDETTHFHFVAWGGKACPTTEEWRKFNHAQKGIHLDDRWVSQRQLHNNFLQDRQAMKLGSFTGVKGIPNQDIVMWVSMGAIVDRSDDILGASDLAIVEFRRLMVDAAKKVAAGGDALGTTEPRVPHTTIASREGVYPKTLDWRTLVEEESVAAE
ncbi:(2Fe-2S)-binding protein [Thalassospira profundimaris]|jgi:phthalate 4,5-dioxygenase oxygenase subunit|uniref:Rieske 2Fe-2S domain-containing protein n=2 Tax=unclassified Thalassospira TaxID=2648997 RepID=UPI0007AD7040|nr:Rieske 2Fe-2S domain-containing protein [Thalassospira sp. MCCC 1A02491]KZB67211.1 (2Fe-2S)-binding protein [Thalassospira sp. MCCC 1A02491]RCK26079.1 (2Fe-2S)-binding protein [Thalassospira profundimaris]